MYPDLQNIKGIGTKRYQTITEVMTSNNWSLADVYAMTPENLKKTFSLPINVAQAVADAGNTIKSTKQSSTTKVEPQNKSLSNKDIRIIKPGDVDYSAKLLALLGDNAPKQLYVWGNLELLNKPSVGFCGSRNVTEKGLSVTADVAQQISELGWVVVSGHARGVDTTAHQTAVENNAGTIIVLPQGMNDFKLRPEIKRHASRDNLLVISEFPPDAGWAVGRAMQRNHTIIGLSDAMVLVEARTEGGTFNAGKQALKYGHPLFVVSYEDTSYNNAGNDYFIQRGATRLMKSKTTGRANISMIRQQVEAKQQDAQTSVSQPKPQQLSMLLESD